jgi:hypothetical protein
VEPLPADNGTHRRVKGEALGVVDVFVAGEPAADRLPQQAEQLVADVLAAPPLGEGRGCRRGEPEGIVQLAVGEQALIEGDPGAVELELQAATEGDPRRALFVSPIASGIPNPLDRCYVAASSGRIAAGRELWSRSNGKSGLYHLQSRWLPTTLDMSFSNNTANLLRVPEAENSSYGKLAPANAACIWSATVLYVSK